MSQTALPQTVFPFIGHFLKGYKGLVGLFMALAIAAGFWGPFNSLLIKQIINLLPEAQRSSITVLLVPAGLIVLNFIVFDNFTWRGIGYIRARFAPVILNQIVQQSMDLVLRKSPQFFQDQLTGKLSKQITNLVDAIEKLILSITANFLRGASLLSMTVVAAYSVHPVFCLILGVWFLFFLTISKAMSSKLVHLADAQSATESAVVGELVDVLANHSNIRIFARRDFEHIRMQPVLEQQRKAYHGTYFYSFLMNCVQGGLIALMVAGSAFSLVYLYGQNLVTVGDFALILGLSMETGHMMWFTMDQLDEYNKAVGRCKQSLQAIMAPVEIQDKPNARSLVCTEGHIIFQKVRFHYKGADALFQNKSIEIQAGEKVGLVGYSGSGKSTFVNLILRLYDITDGAILIDGQDIRDVTQDSLRAHIALIPQDPTLFHRTLFDNISYGKREASLEEIMEASTKAHAHEFITKLPHGYETMVGERGIKLSGGQRQRIAIARAILKNAPILILDEATSQLDSVTETLIQESLWGLMHGKTSIVIAHRLSTLLHMDRILVFDKGKIVEEGTHAALLAKNGVYKRLWSAQIGGFLGDRPIDTEN